MKKAVLAVSVGLLSVASGCGTQSRQSATSGAPSAVQAASTQPVPAPAQPAAIAAADDNCFDATKEQERIDFAQGFKEAEREHGVSDITWLALGRNHEYLIVATEAPAWNAQVQATAQEWSADWRRDWFKPKLQRAVCDAGFAQVKIAVLIPAPSGDPDDTDVHAIYVASVTKRGFVQ